MTPTRKPDGLIGAGFSEYQRTVIPKGAHPTQVQETRRAFYAGARTVMAVLQEIGNHDDISEEAGAGIMASMKLELDRFKLDVMFGRA